MCRAHPASLSGRLFRTDTPDDRVRTLRRRRRGGSPPNRESLLARFLLPAALALFTALCVRAAIAGTDPDAADTRAADTRAADTRAAGICAAGICAAAPPALSFSVGAHLPGARALDDLYGSIPEFGVRLWAYPLPQLRLFVGAGYAFETGDASGADPTFRTRAPASISLWPIEAGVVVDAIAGSKFALGWGIALDLVFARERIGGRAYSEPSVSEVYRGQGIGPRFLLIPEWRPHGGRVAYGLEGSVGIASFDVAHHDSRAHGSGGSSYRLDLTTAAGRAYIARHF